MTTQQQLFTACDDLETKHMELIEGGMCTDISHECSVFCSQVDDHKIYMLEFGEVCVLAVMKNTTLIFDDWLKTASCHHCGETGHVCPNCPKFKADLPVTSRHPSGEFACHRPDGAQPSGHSVQPHWGSRGQVHRQGG